MSSGSCDILQLIQIWLRETHPPASRRAVDILAFERAQIVVDDEGELVKYFDGRRLSFDSYSPLRRALLDALSRMNA